MASISIDARAGTMRFRILGPIDVRDGDGAVALGGRKPRAVLAVLLLHANEPVSCERLALALWGEDAPGETVKMVRVHMSRLRKALGGAAVVATTAGGYRLRVAPGELDADRFEQLTEQGRTALAQGDAELASALLREALALWRGPPLADFVDEPFAASEIARLEDRRLAALEIRLGADLECGRHDAVAAELRGIVADQPTRERFAALLMLALYRGGRQAEALDVFTRTRRTLVDELGVEPGPELRRLQEAILCQDASLDAPTMGPALPLQRAVAGCGTEPVSVLAGCPFKGLASFETADAAFFFGRERLVRRLTEAMSGAPLLGVIGPSGSGKTSLVRAGLMPALAEGLVAGSEHWAQVLVRPGEQPLRELEDAMSAAATADRPVVLTVDQFEEVFNPAIGEPERAAFIQALVRTCVDRARPCHVVLALRADFYGRCADYPELADLLAANQVLVGPMRNQELRQAIEGPSRRAGLLLDPGLADALAHDVDREPGALPLLSTALLELWQRRDGRRLTRVAYDAIGGVRGAVGRLAEGAFGQLSEAQQQRAPGVLLRLVDEVQDGRIERRRVPLAELETLRGSRDVARILALLTDRRLLTVGAGTVELAHEALLREWPRLAGWVEDERDGLRVRRNLCAAAQEWRRVDEDEGALYRGAQLAVAGEWEFDHADRLSPLEREFLDASQAGERRELETARRRTRRLRVLAAGLGALTLAVSGLTLLALDQRGTAQRQRSQAMRQADVSASLALASKSAAQLGARPDVALLLALEANRASPLAEARGNALAALTTTMSPALAGILHGHTNRVSAVAVSRDGRIVASASSDNTIRLWDALTHQPIGAPLTGHSEPVTGVAFSPDGHTLASSSVDGTVRLWDLDLHEQLGDALGGHVGAVLAIAFSRDGNTLASSGADRTIRFWDARSRREIGAPVMSPRGAFTLTFSPSGSLLASSGGDRMIRLWTVRSRRQVGAPLHSHSFANDLTFDPSGRRLVSASVDGRIRFWSVRRHAQLGRPLFAGRVPVNAVAISPDGLTLASAGADGTVRSWDAHTRMALGAPMTGHVGPVLDVAFVGAGNALASAGADRTVRLWRPFAPRRFGVALPGPYQPAKSLQFSPNGDTLATVGGEWSTVLRFWDMRSLRQLAPRPINGWRDLGHGVLRNGHTISVVGRDAGVLRWDVPGRGPGASLATPPSNAQGVVALSHDGRLAASASLDETSIRIHDLRSDRQLGAPISGHHATIADVQFSPDGRTIASVAEDGTIRFWDVRTHRQIGAPMRGSFGHRTRLTFSPDGRVLASAGDDAVIRLWDVRMHRLAGSPLTGHTERVTSLAFTPDGRTLASVAGGDDAIRLWDVGTHAQLGTPISADVGYIYALAFSPDGRSLVAAGQNAIRVWDRLLWRGFAELRATVCRLVGSGLSRVEWAEYAAGIRYRRSCT
jgi:WD40 repeat protein/DNA-binding SARP family transcriptional activator